tara:strand:- start:19759 stop:20184 length:426 start_codon:yes stop_codon:yes gene_type:complete
MEKIINSINKLSIDAQTGLNGFFGLIGAYITLKVSKWFGDTIFLGIINGITLRIKEIVKESFEESEKKNDIKFNEHENRMDNKLKEIQINNKEYRFEKHIDKAELLEAKDAIKSSIESGDNSKIDLIRNFYNEKIKNNDKK